MRRLLLLALLPVALLACTKELRCSQGETACGGVCATLASDAAHCGSCGNACAPAAACLAGSCATCAADTTSCGDACAVLATDPDHCGGCDVACGPAQVCSTLGGATACKATCDAGLAPCGRACADLDDAGTLRAGAYVSPVRRVYSREHRSVTRTSAWAPHERRGW